MSAFTVCSDHIDLLVTALKSIGQLSAEPDAIGDQLICANLASIAARYSEEAAEQDRREMYAEPYRWQPAEVSPVQVVKAARCFAYQACETETWHDSQTARWLRQLEAAIVPAGTDADDMPGYAEAAWEWSREWQAEHDAEQAAERELAEQRARATVKEYTVKETAAAMRKALKERWPAARFSVVMSRGTGYGWIDVSYVDGPKRGDVDTVCRGFQSSDFNGMTDSYDRLPDRLVAGAPGELPTLHRYSCRGVIVQRSFTAEAYAAAARFVQRHVPDFDPMVDSRGEPSGAWAPEMAEVGLQLPDVRAYDVRSRWELLTAVLRDCDLTTRPELLTR